MKRTVAFILVAMFAITSFAQLVDRPERTVYARNFSTNDQPSWYAFTNCLAKVGTTRITEVILRRS